MKLPLIRFSIYKNIFFLNLLNITIFVLGGLFLYTSYDNIPDLVPFFYTLPWGTPWLAYKLYLYIIPAISLLIVIIHLILSVTEAKNARYLTSDLYTFSSIILNILINLYLFRIINLVGLEIFSVPFQIKLIITPFLAAFASTLIVTPFVIKFARKFKFMDDPLIHKHPAMLIKSPIPRAGGLAFLIGILIPALVLLPISTSKKIIGIFIGGIICVLTGLADDRKDLSPTLRLGLQGLAVLAIALSGVILIYIPNPFGEVIKLDDYKFVFEFIGRHGVHYYSVLAAAIWMIWFMNFMSFANGTDGVYAGLVLFGASTISILMLKSLPQDPGISIFIKLASLIAGGGLAMAVFTWPPQKLLWGFGATAPALMIAALSIIGSTKVASTLLVLMVPFLDGIFAVLRRLKRKQLPIWGDREHLHHKLLNMGWSKHKIAIFYWLTTAILATTSILTSGITRAISVITTAIIVAFGISLVNLISPKKKQ